MSSFFFEGVQIYYKGKTLKYHIEINIQIFFDAHLVALVKRL